jgi:3-hydroxyisobutyrate dehydrogenase-like beta-hydroxyacid dehydrogenase
MSTISVVLSDRLTAAHRNAGQAYVAAPAFGRPDAAAAAKLFIVAAGVDTALALCRPLFAAIGQKTFLIGAKPSDGNVVRLIGNFLVAPVLESLGEAFALMRKSGIDPHRYLYGSIIADEKYSTDGFKMSLALKDMRLALAAADAKTVPMPVASLVKDHLLEGVAQGQGDTDWSSLARLCARNAGL